MTTTESYIDHRIDQWRKLLDGPLTGLEQARVTDAIAEFEDIKDMLRREQS